MRLSPLFHTLALVSGLALLAIGCGQEAPISADDGGPDLMRRILGESVLPADHEILDLRRARAGERRALFGDLHVHTTYSFDAYVFGTLATPGDAYRYARGEEIQHPGGFGMQLRQPLDFYAVTDHAMFMGVAAEAGDITTEFSKLPISEAMRGLNDPDNYGMMSLLPRIRNFSGFLPALLDGIRSHELDEQVVLDITRGVWRETIAAADLFNDPGRFTTFVAYEYTTSSDDQGNLHRNVIFKGSDRLPAVPFSRFHSQNPEDLWAWMDGLRTEGIESLAIPHNSNGSNGQMFRLEDWAGDPIDDDYAEQRIRNEPLVEITQVKGTSETHPALSTRDEWADFEIMPYRVATMLESDPPGSYVRDALRRGLAFEQQGVENPYAFGVIGSSDTHTGATSDDESNYFAKVGLLDATAQLRGSVSINWFLGLAVGVLAPNLKAEIDGKSYIESANRTYGASGLAAVWAEENTRESIYQALRRKETFATSGPRMQIRFFGGHDFPADLLDRADGVQRAYDTGVSMGGELNGRSDRAPSFAVWALADPSGTPLQRLQVVKGWVDQSGATNEFVYDIQCSDGGVVNSQTHRCPDNGARVDISDCSITAGRGSAELRSVWRDPDYDPTHRAFYYARVLENPTCRWSTWDAIRADEEPRSDLAKILQERAWTSPIWVRP